MIIDCFGTDFQPVVCIDAPTVYSFLGRERFYPFLGRDRSFMPRNVAHSTKSCAARISTEPSITPCGGIAIPTAAKMIAAENDAIDMYFFIGVAFFNENENHNDNVGDSDNDNENDNENDNVGDKPLAISH